MYIFDKGCKALDCTGGVIPLKLSSLNRWTFLQRLMHSSHKLHTLERADLTQSALKQEVWPGIPITQSLSFSHCLSIFSLFQSHPPLFLLFFISIFLPLFTLSVCLHTFAITDMQFHLVNFFPQSVCVWLFSKLRITCNLSLLFSLLSISLSFKHMLIAFKSMFLKCSFSCWQLWAAANKLRLDEFSKKAKSPLKTRF